MLRFSTLFLTAALAAAQTVAPNVLPALNCEPFHANGIYAAGEKAGWTIFIPPYRIRPSEPVAYDIKKNNRDTVKSGTLDLSLGPTTLEITLDEPAMLYVTLNTKPVTHLGAAIAPTRLQPSVPRPADFDTFWDGKLKALAKVPIHPVLTPTPVLTSTPDPRKGVELYTVQLDSLGSHVQGYLAKPAKEGKFPALVLYQYAGVYALKPGSVTGPAAEGWLAFDVDSHDIPPSQPDGVDTAYPKIGYQDRETDYFLKMYLRDTRAIDYIASRPDWDGKTIVIMGTSMGGQQSLVTAGLNSKVTAVIVNEPAGADLNGDLHGRKAGYPNYPSNDPKVMETAQYFDPVNFASHIKAPVLAGIGFIDTTAPPAGIWTAINQVPGPKEVVPMVESDHNNRTPEKQGEYTSRYKEVLGIILHGGEFRPNEALTRATAK